MFAIKITQKMLCSCPVHGTGFGCVSAKDNHGVGNVDTGAESSIEEGADSLLVELSVGRAFVRENGV